MRALLASTVSVACAAAFAAPLLAPASAAAVPETETHLAAGAAQPRPATSQSLPLRDLDPAPRSGTPTAEADTGAAPGAVGLPAQEVEPFSTLGVVWDDPDAPLGGDAEVRTRATDGTWSPWRTLHTAHSTGRDPGTDEVRGGTDPLWVGAADAVQVRVAPGPDTRERRDTASAAALPEGLRLELLDPGEAAPAADEAGGPAAEGEHRAPPNGAVAAGDDPALTPAAEAAERERELDGADGGSGGVPADARVAEAPRPGVVVRSGWGADESWREAEFAYTDVVKTVFVHHTAGTNDHTCAEAPSVIRGIYQYHTQSLGWRDLGYNFLVDKCGTVYEGRAGGVDRAVLGAHTAGFNHNSMGVALIGSYERDSPSDAAREALAQISGWKLSLDGRPADGTWQRVSAGGGKYSKDTVVTLHNISGHRDGYHTACPGETLYELLPDIRSFAADWK